MEKINDNNENIDFSFAASELIELSLDGIDIPDVLEEDLDLIDKD